MPGEETRNREGGGWRPVPDPTILTTEQLLRAVEAEREYVDGQIRVLEQRLEGIDRATELRWPAVEAFPDAVDEKVNNLRQVTLEKFDSIGKQFAERDTRSERESRDNKVAVDAAFAAQKEAASEQNKSNTLAINKSEIATNETINKLAELFRTTTDSLDGKIDDLKVRVGTIEANTVVRASVTQEHQASIGQIAAIVGAIVLVVNIVVAFVLTSPP